MKLLYISSPSFADCDFPLIKSFQSNGIDVTYLILINPYGLRSTLIDIKNIYPHTGIFPASVYTEFKKFNAYMPLDNVFVCNRHGKSKKSLSYWKEIVDLYLFIKKGKFDIIHTNLLFSDMKKFVYKMGKVITTIHDPFPHSGEDWNYKKSQYYNAIMGSDGIVLLNSKQKDQFCRQYGISEDKILINKLGVYDVINSFQDKSNKAKESANKNILFFGRIAPYKGIEYLCEAMKIIHEEIPYATLTIAGGGNYYFDIRPYQTLDYIEFRNHYIGIDELAELLQRASISVCPYTDATQSGVIMTSFAMSTPVVATDVGGIGEMIENNRTGILVPPRNSTELAKAIISLFKDEKKLKGFKDNITNDLNGWGGYSWTLIAQKYISFYNTLL